MKNRDLLIGFVTGAAAAFLIKEVNDRRQTLYPADDVLESVKNAFKEEGPIDGSWIYMKAEPFNRYAISTDVYKGGISRHKDDELQQFEFAADAYTGAIVEINKV